eukprot:6228340-Karenia_brevis.AAC.1
MVLIYVSGGRGTSWVARMKRLLEGGRLFGRTCSFASSGWAGASVLCPPVYAPEPAAARFL